jgi:signal transduction histidine kinase
MMSASTGRSPDEGRVDPWRRPHYDYRKADWAWGLTILSLAASQSASTRPVMPLVRTELGHQDVALVLDLASELPAVVGDRVQLQQVVLNLVMNALDAMASI